MSSPIITIEHNLLSPNDPLGQEMAMAATDKLVNELLSVSDGTIPPLRDQAHAFKEDMRKAIYASHHKLVRRVWSAAERATMANLKKG